MKSSKLKLTVALTGLLMGLSAVTVHANEGGKTRAQVKAELKDALARGEVYFNDVDYPPTPVFKSTKSRDQVRNEVRQAMARGEVLFSEVDYPPMPVATGPGRTRAEVVAEVMEAKRNGTLQIDEVYYPDHRNSRYGYGIQLANKSKPVQPVAAVQPSVQPVQQPVVAEPVVGAADSTPTLEVSTVEPLAETLAETPVETADAGDRMETTSTEN